MKSIPIILALLSLILEMFHMSPLTFITTEWEM